MRNYEIKNEMKIIGLTGGIGTGKSTVSAYLMKKGCYILDADKISRELTSAGGKAIESIRQTFGDEVFFDDGTLNRKKLGEIVFSDSHKLEILQELTTQKVVEKIYEELKRLKREGFSGIVVIDAPLLFECNMQTLTDENWLVTADLQVRIERIIKRDELPEDRILDRINNQMSDEKKSELADHVIDNSGNLVQLYLQIDSLIERA